MTAADVPGYTNPKKPRMSLKSSAQLRNGPLKPQLRTGSAVVGARGMEKFVARLHKVACHEDAMEAWRQGWHDWISTHEVRR